MTKFAISVIMTVAVATLYTTFSFMNTYDKSMYMSTKLGQGNQASVWSILLSDM
jgi:hypothetical protein